jgi:hypothetical protein
VGRGEYARENSVRESTEIQSKVKLVMKRERERERESGESGERVCVKK